MQEQVVIAAADGSLPKQGLERRFTEGESLPWKGIWFEVSNVTPDRIILKPTGETWANHKRRKNQ